MSVIIGARIGINLGEIICARIGINLGELIGARIGINLGKIIGVRVRINLRELLVLIFGVKLGKVIFIIDLGKIHVVLWIFFINFSEHLVVIFEVIGIEDNGLGLADKSNKSCCEESKLHRVFINVFDFLNYKQKNEQL